MAKVALVTPWNTRDQRSWSGVVAPMAAAMRDRFDLTEVVTSDVRDSIVDRALCRLLDGRGGRQYLVGHAVATSLKRGAALRSRLSAVDPDVVVAVAASQDIAFLRGPWPVIQISDTTLHGISGYYDLFSSLDPLSRRQAEIVSARSAARTQRTLAVSEWARDSLIKDDGVGPASVVVAPFGPAITPQGGEVARPTVGPIRLLLVASNWQRKGGDRALLILEELHRRGVDVSLTVVGDPPSDLPNGVVNEGRVSSERLAHLYASHHILLEPARANAAGVTLTDAAWFGLPAVATRTGGVSSIVADGDSGLLIDESPDFLAHAADAVVRIIPDLDAWSVRAQARAHAELSWETWISRLSELIEAVV